MAIECYAQQADAYDYLHNADSVIVVRECAAQQFMNIDRSNRAAQTLGSAITSALEKKDIVRAKKYMHLYESESGLFDVQGNIEEGRETYYYAKGQYYLTINELDSAERMFRKELRDGKDLNNQIAGCKGLQEVFVHRVISDSIAKYAMLSYQLNDSAYSLSEMQNVQQLQASYNYNYHQFFAKQKDFEAKIAWLISIIVIVISILLYFL